MDRMDEYRELLAQLEQEPEVLTGVVDRARDRVRRTRRRRRTAEWTGGFLSLAACFVLAVNLCTPVALACGRVPILRELAQAVIVSPSLSAAVANEHVQLVGQEQTVNGYTIRLEYVIADKKQLNAFLTVDGPAPEEDGRFLVSIQAVEPEGVEYSSSGAMLEPGELDYAMLNFHEADTPQQLTLRVQVDSCLVGRERLAECDFSLELDPYQLKLGRTVEVNEDFTLNGNRLTLSTVELYPTHMRLHVEKAEDDPDYLVSLMLTIDGDGHSVKRVDSKGLTSTGSARYSTYTMYTASPWYYDCDTLKLTISGAVWLDKDRLETTIDLTQGTAQGLPDGVTYLGIADQSSDPWGSGRELCFQGVDTPFAGAFSSDFVGEDGQTYRSPGSSWSTTGSSEPDVGRFSLGDYQGDLVILENHWSHVAEYEQPLVLTVDVSGK